MKVIFTITYYLETVFPLGVLKNEKMEKKVFQKKP